MHPFRAHTICPSIVLYVCSKSCCRFRITRQIVREFLPPFLPPSLQVSLLKQSGRGIERQLQFDSLKDVHMAEYMCNASNFYNRDKEGRRVDVRQVVRVTVICKWESGGEAGVAFALFSSPPSSSRVVCPNYSGTTSFSV